MKLGTKVGIDLPEYQNENETNEPILIQVTISDEPAEQMKQRAPVGPYNQWWAVMMKNE